MPFRQIDKDIYSALEHMGGATYDRKAKGYEWMVSTSLFNKIIWATTPGDYTRFAREAVLHSKGPLLDIGCGGLSKTYMLYSSTEIKCVLLDRSVEMLKIGRSRLIKMKGYLPDNITLLQADAFQLPFADSSFDTVCSYGTIHLFNNKQDFVDEALRVLKPGGKFSFLSMTNSKMAGKLFMSVLHRFNEFGKIFTPGQTLSLFDERGLAVESYMIGNVLFIKGEKLNHY